MNRCKYEKYYRLFLGKVFLPVHHLWRIPVSLSTAAAAAKSLQSCPTLCEPIDGSPPGSPIPGILQARTLEWVAISFSNAWKWKAKVKSLSRVQLSDPMDCSLPGSSIHGIFQARVLEGVPLPSPISKYTDIQNGSFILSWFSLLRLNDYFSFLEISYRERHKYFLCTVWPSGLAWSNEECVHLQE